MFLNILSRFGSWEEIQQPSWYDLTAAKTLVRPSKSACLGKDPNSYSLGQGVVFTDGKPVPDGNAWPAQSELFFLSCPGSHNPCCTWHRLQSLLKTRRTLGKNVLGDTITVIAL